MSESKYQKGKIYKILNSIDDEVYVGSTIESLSKRMAKHRAKCNTKTSYKIYHHMAKHGKEHFYIELIAHYPCETKEELVAKEGEWIRNIGTLNQIVAGRSKKDWYEDNKKEHLEKMATYRVENRETIRQKKKEHRDANIEVIREKDRQRYKDDPEKRKANVKQWRDKNPEYKEIEMTCDICKCQVKKCRWSTHTKTKMHINNQEKTLQ